MTEKIEEQRGRHSTRVIFISLAAIGLLVGVSSLQATGSTTSSRALTITAPSIPTPLSTSLQSSGGTWATVPMGHLDQPLNTFWQLFFRPTGSTSWSDRVEATATATNGGLVLASTSRQGLVVGIRPSNYLHFSPMISTNDAGKSWSNGLLSNTLVARPDALAAGPSGEMLAIVNAPGGAEVVSSTGSISVWRLLTSKQALAKEPSPSSCGLATITAVAYLGSAPVVGGSCTHTGVVGLFVDRSGDWRLIGPTLPQSLRGGRTEILGLQATNEGFSALVGVTSKQQMSLVAEWTNRAGDWERSAPLEVGLSENIESFGSAGGTGFFVLLKTPSGTTSADVAGATGTRWGSLPSPPNGTATLAFGPTATPEALVVHDAVLTIWSLASSSDTWLRRQVLKVSILYGSSA